MGREPGKEVKKLDFNNVVTEKPISSDENNINSNVIDSSTFNEIDHEEDIMGQLRRDNPARANSTKLHGVYFDLDVSDAINAAAKGLGRGGKSALVNRVMKRFLKEEGFLK